jgi:hypothetical protein
LKHTADRKRKNNAEYKNKRKITKFQKNQSSENSTAYGINNADSVSETNHQILDSCLKYFHENIFVTLNDILHVEKATREQSECDEWFLERRKRITASNFGKFCKCKSDTALCNLVRRIAYPQPKLNTVAIKHGKRYEQVALEKYGELYTKKYIKSGLVIHPQLPFLAASPDAIICNDSGETVSIIEVKCPYNAKSFTEIDFSIDAQLCSSKKKIKFLNWNNNSLFLKESHDYYYQIQAILFILNVQLAKLLVYASDNDALIVVEVIRNDKFLKGVINKISNRYFRYYLSEISTNRKLNNRPAFFFNDEFFESNIKSVFSFLDSDSNVPSFVASDSNVPSLLASDSNVPSFLASDSNISSFENTLRKEYSTSKSVREAIDILMSDKSAHIISHQPLENTLASFSLRKIPARGDGHCILHSWEINTGIVQSEIKEKLVVEYLGQPVLYSTYDVSFDELNQYLNLRNYSLNTVDSILPMLCNVFNHAAYIFSETVSGNGKERSTLIQLINPKFSGTKSENFAFLLKNDDHYDGLVFMTK